MNSITDVLTSKVAPASIEEAHRLAEKHFGLIAVAAPLSSERDQNFHLKAPDGQEYVMKITNPAEDRLVTNFQTEALRHIAAVDPAFPVQKVLATLLGEFEPVITLADGTSRVVRLLTFAQGVPLYQVKRTSALRHDLGATQARLDLALRGFFHPAAGHELPWDIKQACRLRPLLAHIPDQDRRALAERFMNQFEEHALPVLPRLRGQVIHNDFQPWNVLVDAGNHDKVAGVIDFGDLVYAPMIDDLAVACAHHLADSPEPLTFASEVISAYHSVLPLEEDEVDILFDLIAVRLVMTVAITGWRAALHPENAAYILRNNPWSWNGLDRFAGLTRGQAQQVLRRTCMLD